MARPGLQALRDALDAERTKSGAARREARITKAIEDWRHTPRGQGHNGFFRLGAALQRAGVDEDEIEQTLRAEAPSGASGRERRSEIKDILCRLGRRGSFRKSRGLRGLSQTRAYAAGRAGPARFSRFVNLRKSETDTDQLVLLANRPRASEPEALAQPHLGTPGGMRGAP